MIPPLDSRGLLPQGRHPCTDWDELEFHFGTNDYRVSLLTRAKEFVRDRLTPIGSGLELVVGGSFLTDKACPGDIDIVVIIPIKDVVKYSQVLTMFATEGAKGPIWEEYKVEFYVQLDGAGNSLALFFEYVGEKSAEAKGLSPKDKRGTVGIESWTLG